MGVSHIAMSLANLLRVTAEAAHISALVPGVDDYYMDVLWHWVLVASVDHVSGVHYACVCTFDGCTCQCRHWVLVASVDHVSV